jgi:hypothetical protein
VPKDLHAGWVVAGVLAIVLFLFVWAAYKLYAERDRPFPKVQVDVGGISNLGRSKLWDLLAIRAHVTNQERTDGISLTFLLYYQYGPNVEDRSLVPPASKSFVDLPENLKLLQVHPMPLNLDPMTGDAGSLVFVWHSEMGSGVQELEGVVAPGGGLWGATTSTDGSRQWEGNRGRRAGSLRTAGSLRRLVVSRFNLAASAPKSVLDADQTPFTDMARSRR